MRINGKSYKKTEVLSIFTDEGLKEYEKGVICDSDVIKEFRIFSVKKLTGMGPAQFAANYRRIPEGLRESLPFEDLAELVKAFADCYADGKHNI